MPIPGERTATLGPWPRGAHNVGPENSVPPRHVRKALNIDFDDSGKPRRRDGRTRVIIATEPRCLWGNNRRMLFAVGGSLYEVDASLDPREIATDISPTATLAYCEIEPYVYVSDTERAFRVDRDGLVTSWTVPTPTQLAVVATGTGGLDEGRYLVAAAYVNDTGEESPPTRTMEVVVAAGQALRFTLPAAPAGVSRARFYMTKPNGTQLLLAATAPVASTVVTIMRQRLGRPLIDNEYAPLPAGQFAAYFNGRLYVSIGPVIYWSEPNHYSVMSADFNFLPFAGDVTMLAAPSEGSAGFFAATADRTYFVRGNDPSDTQLVEAYSAGAIANTMTHVPGANLALDNPVPGTVPMWIAANGVFCAGLPDGTVFAMTEQRFVSALAGTGAAGYRLHRGTHQFVASLLNPITNLAGFSDSVSTTIVRNGIEL